MEKVLSMTLGNVRKLCNVLFAKYGYIDECKDEPDDHDTQCKIVGVFSNTDIDCMENVVISIYGEQDFIDFYLLEPNEKRMGEEYSQRLAAYIIALMNVYLPGFCLKPIDASVCCRFEEDSLSFELENDH